MVSLTIIQNARSRKTRVTCWAEAGGRSRASDGPRTLFWARKNVYQIYTSDKDQQVGVRFPPHPRHRRAPVSQRLQTHSHARQLVCTICTKRVQKLVCVSDTADKLLADIEGAGDMRRLAPPRRETATSFDPWILDHGSRGGFSKTSAVSCSQTRVCCLCGFAVSGETCLAAHCAPHTAQQFTVPTRPLSSFKTLEGCARIEVRTMWRAMGMTMGRVMNFRSFSVRVGFNERWCNNYDPGVCHGHPPTKRAR